ncbi:Myb-like DNA-binding protein [Phytophthora megakarya]|uniref:Myb-like DNA-binding protein n=1 Tax=Phytophthora megakarya TaxID=4795 RepID=A0A225WPY0_9STRA|nr:Myb-like DNA-binding protein [Phytophthora megakarya]
MAISDQVRSQLFSPTCSAKAIRIPTTRGGATRSGLVPHSPTSGRGLWTPEEHLRFLEALDKYPSGPWKCIAAYVGNKTARQAMTHGQKYRQKIARRRRGLKKIVRDLQFAAAEAQPEDTERLSVESIPTGLSDQDFEDFVTSLDLAVELQQDALNMSQLGESPLVVPTATYDENVTTFSLETEVPTPPTSESGLPLTTPQQDVHHWVVMNRADATSEEFSAMLAQAFQFGAEAEEYARPEQLLGEFCKEQESVEPVIAANPLESLENLCELGEFELR